MLKDKNLMKLGSLIAITMLAIGIVLSGIGFAMAGNVDYLKEDGNHKWYQIVFIDDRGWFRVGLTFEDSFSFGHISFPDAPKAPDAPDIFQHPDS